MTWERKAESRVCHREGAQSLTFTSPIIVREDQFFVAFSIGTAIYPTDGQDIDSLVRHADQSMYVVKNREGEIRPADRVFYRNPCVPALFKDKVRRSPDQLIGLAIRSSISAFHAFIGWSSSSAVRRLEG